jgi:hypothetical protein
VRKPVIASPEAPPFPILRKSVSTPQPHLGGVGESADKSFFLRVFVSLWLLIISIMTNLYPETGGRAFASFAFLAFCAFLASFAFCAFLAFELAPYMK